MPSHSNKHLAVLDTADEFCSDVSCCMSAQHGMCRGGEGEGVEVESHKSRELSYCDP